MVKWEYMITGSSDKRRPHTGLQQVFRSETSHHYDMVPKWDISLEEWLNQLGEDGWDIAGSSGASIILKRQKT
jgi:hypothetical protein